MPVKASASNAIQKGCAVLRVLSVRTPLRLTDVARQAALNKVTALRVLDVLVEEGFVTRTDDGRGYALGRESLAMAAAARSLKNLQDVARPSLTRLAEFSQDTALLSVRSGNEAVCLDRRVGTYPIQANYLDVGSRRPLGVGAGSMVLLAWLGETEAAAALEATAARLETYPRLSVVALREQAALTRRRGFALLLDVVVERMGGVAVPILARDGTALGALSLAALSERIAARTDVLVPALQREAARIAAELE
ncbi:MAG: IclR family transcriptional regulator [Candidatus Velthaea sp.]